jgi:hypothetical protein
MILHMPPSGGGSGGGVDAATLLIAVIIVGVLAYTAASQFKMWFGVPESPTETQVVENQTATTTLPGS